MTRKDESLTIIKKLTPFENKNCFYFKHYGQFTYHFPYKFYETVGHLDGQRNCQSV